MQPRYKRSTTAARPVAPTPKAAERPVEKPVEFISKQLQAQSVAIAGTFNKWDPQRTSLRKERDAWKITLWLPPGRYEYRFVVDGQWLSDPAAKESVPNPFGGVNSIVVV
jgi:1,4-alpha-glucan branching enzyme